MQERKRKRPNMRCILCCCISDNKYAQLDAKLERKMVECRRNFPGHRSFKSIDSIIMKFPWLREGLRNMRHVFVSYDKDCNGTIDREELKNCLEELSLRLSEEEVEDLYRWCDVDGRHGIQLNEFIVLLCLIYLFTKPSSDAHTASAETGSWKEMEATFDPIVEAFLFLDKNCDGMLNKSDVLKTMNHAYPWEKSPSHVTKMRFEEMDWGRKGKVGFREFLFAFISWVALDDADADAAEDITIMDISIRD